MSDLKSVPIEVDNGSFVIDNRVSHIYRSGPNIMLLIIDCTTKRGEVTWIGSDDDIPDLGVAASEDSSYAGDCDRDQATTVTFPTLHGWTMHMATVSRYTLSVCLIRGD